jgi:hypothetical protein
MLLKVSGVLRLWAVVVAVLLLAAGRGLLKPLEEGLVAVMAARPLPAW